MHDLSPERNPAKYGRPMKLAILICLIQPFETDFLWKGKTLNSGIILKTFTHVQILDNDLAKKQQRNYDACTVITIPVNQTGYKETTGS